jgi:hypothetical protein
MDGVATPVAAPESALPLSGPPLLFPPHVKDADPLLRCGDSLPALLYNDDLFGPVHPSLVGLSFLLLRGQVPEGIPHLKAVGPFIRDGF